MCRSSKVLFFPLAILFSAGTAFSTLFAGVTGAWAVGDGEDYEKARDKLLKVLD